MVQPPDVVHHHTVLNSQVFSLNKVVSVSLVRPQSNHNALFLIWLYSLFHCNGITKFSFRACDTLIHLDLANAKTSATTCALGLCIIIQ